ncbi:hypothetical protein [Helicobacter pylori]|uniref:hypothetical protein n=1 Tax=Helicobacter pylori TaxID=210 RepID=UPI0012FEA032|nr:hypothetical protein [Helicobacter pylori]
MAFYHSIILSFYHSIILSFKHSSIQAFKHSIKQRYPTFTTFIKTYLKIPYFLLFSLLFLFSLTHTAFLNHLIP